MVHIYCGGGKGKTTAAMGLAARMAGNGGRVHIVQFLKDGKSGEIAFFGDTKSQGIGDTKTFAYGDTKTYGPGDTKTRSGDTKNYKCGDTKMCSGDTKTCERGDTKICADGDTKSQGVGDTKITVRCCDRSYGFYKDMSEADKAEITACHNRNLDEALSVLPELDMLVLDEVFAALNYGLADEEKVRALLEADNTEVVLTGREPSKYFLERADYVSEIKSVKHPFERGIKARKGIEY